MVQKHKLIPKQTTKIDKPIATAGKKAGANDNAIKNKPETQRSGPEQLTASKRPRLVSPGGELISAEGRDKDKRTI